MKNNFKKNFKKFLNSTKRILKNGVCVFIFLLGIEAFTFKIPYCIVLGVFLVLISLLFFPWLDKILDMIKFKLSTKNKWFIGITIFLIAAYLITPEETSYYMCILPIFLMILVWVITLCYVKRKRDKNV